MFPCPRSELLRLPDLETNSCQAVFNPNQDVRSISNCDFDENPELLWRRKESPPAFGRDARRNTPGARTTPRRPSRHRVVDFGARDAKVHGVREMHSPPQRGPRMLDGSPLQRPWTSGHSTVMPKSRRARLRDNGSKSAIPQRPAATRSDPQRIRRRILSFTLTFQRRGGFSRYFRETLHTSSSSASTTMRGKTGLGLPVWWPSGTRPH